jgi:arabinofuranosyltransferase
MGVLMVRLAWLGDDALITLRTALNVSHGWGPGFNFTENVQAYTHPLWFLAWLVLGTVTGEWILSILAFGIVLSLAAVALVLWATRSITVIVGAGLVLTLSNAFMEYSTSGLENPLGYFVLGLVTLSLWSIASSSEQKFLPIYVWIATGGLIAAAVLTRFDFILLLAPTLLIVLLTRCRQWRQSLLMLGTAALPVVAWLVWSWNTYGSFLPNTFLAKRSLDIPVAEVWLQGLRYLWVSAVNDPVTALVLFVSVVVLLSWGNSFFRASAVGLFAYLVFTVYVGGDFMAGRFLAAPVYLGVLLTVKLISQRTASRQALPRQESRGLQAVGIALVGLLVLTVSIDRTPTALASPTAARWDDREAGNVYDARGKFLELEKGLEQWAFSWDEPLQDPTFSTVASLNTVAPFRDIRAAANAWPRFGDVQLRTPRFPAADGSIDYLPNEVGIVCGLLGSSGILTGPTVHWIDTCALADRYLANTPFQGRNFDWLVGHYVREAPEGYPQAVYEGDPRLVVDPQAARDLESLWSVIRK